MCDSVSPPTVVQAGAKSLPVLIILCKNFSRVLRSTQTNGPLANARGRPLTAFAENGCGSDSAQAWAEFCIAYCKRMDLLHAIPARRIECAGRAL